VITVYSIDGTDIYREALGRIIASVRGLQPVGDSGSGRTGLTRICLLRPDIVILDDVLPDMTGFEVVRSIRHAAIPCIVIMVSDHANPYFRETAIMAGVDYILDKFLESQKIGPILETLVRLFSGVQENTVNGDQRDRPVSMA
jgi:DNA-binding NarL/FixJ family response regulator